MCIYIYISQTCQNWATKTRWLRIKHDQLAKIDGCPCLDPGQDGSVQLFEGGDRGEVLGSTVKYVVNVVMGFLRRTLQLGIELKLETILP